MDKSMTYTILNRVNGSASEMYFDTENQLCKWLESNKSFENLGVISYTLPTRHVRMNSEVKV